jgi:4'-phosphopantetheinyl transferase EntD
LSTNPHNPPAPNLRSAALSPLFPAPVLVIERRLPGDPAELKPGESHYVARARAKRLQEFAAGRACARTALAAFGVHGAELPAATDRQPVWPPGFVGSITHTSGFCAAAVAPKQSVRSLGVDTEVVGAPTPDIWSTLCRDEELEWLDALAVEHRPAAVTLVFSAKEAFYKCQYPLVAEWLDFHDVRIDVPDWHGAAADEADAPGAAGRAGLFTAAAMRTIRFAGHAVLPLTGRFVFHEQYVSAGVWLANLRP